MELKPQYPMLFWLAAALLALLATNATIDAAVGQIIPPPQATPGLDAPSASEPSATATSAPGAHSFTIVPMTREQREEFMRHFMANQQRAKLIALPPLAAQKIDPETARQK